MAARDVSSSYEFYLFIFFVREEVSVEFDHSVLMNKSILIHGILCNLTRRTPNIGKNSAVESGETSMEIGHSLDPRTTEVKKRRVLGHRPCLRRFESSLFWGLFMM